MAIYRKIYELHFGPIPKDSEGRTFEIHHIDGDHSNNAPENLKAVSIEEHFELHKNQGDYFAALLISARMKINQSEKSELARLNALNQIQNGTSGILASNRQRMHDSTHHFLNENFQSKIKTIQKEKLKNGTHHMLGNSISMKRLQNETHNFLTQNSITYHCKNCDKLGKGPRFKSKHFPACEAKKPHSGPRGKINRNKNPIKLECPHCQKLYDPGNLKRHLARVSKAAEDGSSKSASWSYQTYNNCGS